MLRVFGEDVPVRARVVLVDSLSAHADGDELVAWLASGPRAPAAVSVVHGEARAADTLRRRVRHELGSPAALPSAGNDRRRRGVGEAATTSAMVCSASPVAELPSSRFAG
jgi:Cft2 family RNA processing exonuclease